ncbi:hypothetical protein FB45DRAFT_1062224 [Roridomyces roridus]|uniref:Aminoglycoside phosphotransferase domain-containing protein n=1 Tax=Roridomyces roridus TaxID=1738132 RepID=A0AAD7BHV2_9AGAR|nr:hypothetical protein FB45DRAFT_1062224 [Roridomyces roridus]
MSLNIEQAQAIATKHFSSGQLPTTVVNLNQIHYQEYSFTPALTTYLLDLASSPSANPTHSSFLVVSQSQPEPRSQPYSPNALSLFPTIISSIRANTSIPIPEPTLDTTLSLIPYAYLVTPIYHLSSSRLITLADARASGQLTPEQLALIDLQLGKYLGELHNGAQNDYFGLPTATPPADPSYDWQETFTALLESLIDAVPDSADLPITTLRSALGRAISAFLFSDVDVPSLVWFTGSPNDVLLAFSETGQFAAFAILPAVGHALWGDPLLETFFMDASDAFWEGYRGIRGAQDGTLMAFPRQRTKRLWYDVFLALVVLRERRGLDDQVSLARSRWAVESLKMTAEKLKNAPCY